MSLITGDAFKKFPFYKVSTVASFGWLKRAELGNAWLDVWEAPSGAFFNVKRGHMPEIAIFTPPPGAKAEGWGGLS